MIYKIAVVENLPETLIPESTLLKFREIFFVDALDVNMVKGMLLTKHKGPYVIIDQKKTMEEFPEGDFFTVLYADDDDSEFPF